MKLSAHTIFAIILHTSFFSQTFAQQSIKANIIHDQLQRNFSFYVPASYIAGTAVPLVFNLHGYSSNADQQEFYGDFRKIADTAGFIIVHPNGTVFPQTGFQFWNVGLVGNSNVDDVGFIHAIIDTLSKAYSIDKNRIYSTGMSNGGFMSYHLACLSDRFAAIASVTGSMTTVTQVLCKNARPMPIMEIHGTADAVVNYNGSSGILSIPEVLNFWIQKNGLDANAVIKMNVPDLNTGDGSNAEHFYYPGSYEVEHYKVINGGHTWPGTPFVIGTTCQDFNASEVIWKFFNKHQKQTVNTREINTMEVSVHPIPANEYIWIRFNDNVKKPVSIVIRNVYGQIILQYQTVDDQFSIDIRSVPSGVCLIQCSNGHESFYSSFVKI